MTPDRRYRIAVGKPAITVGPLPCHSVAVFLKVSSVTIEQFFQKRKTLNDYAILVLRKHMRTSRVKSAEVEEGGRSAIYIILAFSLLNESRRQVPVGDVVRIVSQNVDSGKETWYEVDPLLVNKHPTSWIHPAVLAQPVLPPA